MLVRRCRTGFASFALGLLFLVAATVHATARDRVALVVGNSDYQFISALPNPSNDATAIQAKLEDLGFNVIPSIDADRARLRADLDRFTAAARGAEVALIFYAGHGLQISGENYLLPVDAAISAPADLNTSAVRASDLYQAFLEAGPELAILILDACRDNPLAGSLGTAPGLTSGSVSPRQFVQQPESAGMIIAFAAAPGAVAYDGTDGNSPYTTALLQWIDRPGLELGTMFRRVRGTVLDLTQGAQVPWVEEALLREVYLNPIDPGRIADVVEGARIELALLDTIRALDDPAEQAAAVEFYDRFVVSPEADASVQRASLDVDGTLSQDEDFAQQGLIWLSIRKSDDPDVFRAFLNYFPQSPFEDLARKRIDDLDTADPVEVFAELDTGNFGVATDALVPLESLIPQDDSAPAPASPGGLAGTLSAATTPKAETLPPASPAEMEARLGFGAGELAAVQSLLAEAGLYRGPIDADYGPGTRGAIERYQDQFGLTRSGYLDAPTLQSLVRRTARQVLLRDQPQARRDAIHRVAAVAARGPGAVPRIIRVASFQRNDEIHAFWRDVGFRFEASRPGFRVEFVFEPETDYKATLMAKLGSGAPPDILHTWGGGHLEAMVDAGFVRDLTDPMSDDWAMEFRPGVLKNYTFDGRIYGAPMQMSLVSLWVNTNVMRQAGIPLDRLSTWEGFLSAAADLKAQGIAPIAIGGRDRWPFQFFWSELVQGLGGDAAFQAAYDGMGDGFNAPVFVEAGREFRRLADLEPFQPDYLGMDDGRAGELVAQGAAAMVLTGNWRLQSMRWHWPGGLEAMNRELAHLPFPSIGTAGPAGETYGGVDGFAVNAEAPPEAVELLRLMTSRETQERMVDLAFAVPTVSGADIALQDPLLRDVARELLESSRHQLYYDQVLGPTAGETLTDVAMAIGTRAMSGREAASELDAAWDGILARGIREDAPGAVQER